MSRIRVKNKHLVLIVFLALLTMGAERFWGGDYLWFQAKRAQEEGDAVKALAYYDALIERYPKHSRVPEALYWSAELLPSSDSFAAVFFPSSSWVQRSGEALAELQQGTLSRVERYLKIKEHYSSHWAAAHVDFKLAHAYQALGDPRAEELYLQALYNDRASNRLEAGFRLAQIYQSQGLVQEALAVLEFCRTELVQYLPLEGQIQLGDLLAGLGDLVGAREAYAEALSQAENIQEYFPPGEVEGEVGRISVVEEYRERISAKLSSLERLARGEVVEVQGRVMLLGEPLAGVPVYVRERSEGSLAYSSGQRELGRWLTDQGGRFAGNLAVGEYEFGIGLNHHQAQLVEGTHLQIRGGHQDLRTQEPAEIEFNFVERVELTSPARDFVYAGGPISVQWEPYPGAQAYQVTVAGLTLENGGASYVVHPVGITEATSFLFAGQNITPFGLISIDAQGVEPSTLAARPESFAALRISVNALDEEGRVLASSSGLHFGQAGTGPGEILVQAGLRSEAEKLLYDRQYDQAVKLLEQRVAENLQDLDSLWILARIYFSGTHSTSQDPWDASSFAHRDLAKSLAALERIQELQPGAEVEEALEVVRGALAH